MAPGSNGWFRRRSPRLSGTLHIRDTTGRELVIPLRGRASLLTTGATRLRGYGEVWAVHTTAPAAETSLMIIYGGSGRADLASGLCAAGQTIVLDGVTFTWRAPSTQAQTPSSPGTPAQVPGTLDTPSQVPGTPVDTVPRQRPAPNELPHNLRTPPARSSNTRSEPAPATGLRSRLRNMVRVVTQATRH